MPRGLRRNVGSRLCFGGLILATSALPACATVFGYSGPQDVELASTPAGAEFELRSTRGGVVQNGTLPATVQLNTKWNYRLKVRAPGYKETVVTIDSSFNSWTLCNAVCCWPGFLLDGVNGAMFELPESVSITLRPGSDSPAVPSVPPPAPPAYDPNPPPAPIDIQPPSGGTVRAPGAPLQLVLARRNERGERMLRVVTLQPLDQASRL